jgi:hypothetical protein
VSPSAATLYGPAVAEAGTAKLQEKAPEATGHPAAGVTDAVPKVTDAEVSSGE